MLKAVTACAVVVTSVLMPPPAAAQDCRGESAMICGLVWNDANTNGLQDPGESGIARAKVILSSGSGSVLFETDSTGFYRFTDVDKGSYVVSISIASVPLSHAQSSPANAGDDAVDSDGTGDGITASVAVEVETVFQKRDLDFGFHSTPASRVSSSPR
jgi:hypothetical protein